MPTPNYYAHHKSKLANETNRLLEVKFALLRTLLTTECTLLAVLAAFLPTKPLPTGARMAYFVVLALLLLSILTTLLSLYGRIVLAERFVADYHDRLEIARATESRVGDVEGYIPKFANLFALISIIAFLVALVSLLCYAYFTVIVGS